MTTVEDILKLKRDLKADAIKPFLHSDGKYYYVWLVDAGRLKKTLADLKKMPTKRKRAKK